MTLSRGGAYEIWQCRPKIVGYIFNRSCKLQPDSFHVIENGPKFSKEMRNKFHWLHNLGRVEFKFCTIYNTTNNLFQCLMPAHQRTAVPVRTLHTSHYAPRTLSFSIVCIRWSVPVFVLQFHKDHRHSWIFMPAWNNLHPVPMDPLSLFENLLKTKLFVWTRTQLECAFVRFV